MPSQQSERGIAAQSNLFGLSIVSMAIYHRIEVKIMNETIWNTYRNMAYVFLGEDLTRAVTKKAAETVKK